MTRKSKQVPGVQKNCHNPFEIKKVKTKTNIRKVRLQFSNVRRPMYEIHKNSALW